MMAESRVTSNPVAERVAKGPLSSRGKWQEVVDESDEVPLNANAQVDFPQLSEDELKSKITCGTYQLKQAQHYADEHLFDKGGFTLFLHRTAPDLVRVRLQSRHKNSTKYFVWVQHSATDVTGWYCQCKAGQRTVGCCAHVATVVWYLGWARHHNYTVSERLHKFWESVVDSDPRGEYFDPEEDSAELDP